MTLLVALNDEERSFLISDILHLRTTSDVKHIPHAIHPIEQVLTEEYWRSAQTPTRKTYIINGQFCAGVAGNYFTAKAMILELNDKFGDHEASMIDLESFLRATNFGRESAVLVGLVAEENKVKAFRYETSKKLFSLDEAFFEGTGGKPFEERLNIPARRARAEIKRPGGRPPERESPIVLHEIAEMSYLQHNSGHYFLEEFGGGFQIIEYHHGRFVFVDNYLMLGCFATMDIEGLDFGFDQSVVLQRYVDGKFTVATCPVDNNPQIGEVKLNLRVTETKYNVAEDWLNPQDLQLDIMEIWQESSIEYYMMPIIWRTPAHRTALSSIVTKTVKSDYYTVRLLSDQDHRFVRIGENFEVSISNHYQDMREIIAKMEGNDLLRTSSDVSMLRRMEGCLFSESEILVDGHSFVNCTFTRCRIAYAGGVVQFLGCEFHGCTVVLVDKAKSTVAFIGSILRPESGMQDLALQLLRYYGGIGLTAASIEQTEVMT